jgi:hypothetical protein
MGNGSIRNSIGEPAIRSTNKPAKNFNAIHNPMTMQFRCTGSSPETARNGVISGLLQPRRRQPNFLWCINVPVEFFEQAVLKLFNGDQRDRPHFARVGTGEGIVRNSRASREKPVRKRIN